MEKAFGYHPKHHSEHMTIAENGYSALKKDPQSQYAHGAVYSDQSVKGDCEFEVEITSYGASWSGNIKLGIMRCQSEILPNIPRYSPEALNHCVWAATEFYNYIIGGNLETYPYGKITLDSLRQGDRLSLHITEEGDLSFSVNGKDQGVAMRGVYKQGWNVYIVVDHYGNCVSTRIIKASLGSSQGHHALQIKNEEIQKLRDQIKDLEETMAEFQQANVTLAESNQKLREDNDRYKHLLQTNQPHWVVQGSEVKITQELLGKGSWGQIKVAMFRGTRVAAKCLHEIILSEYNLELFSREMEIAARLRHPNLLQFIGATRETLPIILSEIMPTSLYKELQKSRFTRPQIVCISRHVALALNYLHLWKPQPIIHRDISSPNILLETVGSGQWKAKVSDFGSANLQHRVKTEGPGNPSYAAPESRFPDEHSPAMDVYSYGVLLTEMIICRPPDMTTAGRLQQVQRIEWPPMKSLVQHCVNHKRNERFSINVVLETLNKI